MEENTIAETVGEPQQDTLTVQAQETPAAEETRFPTEPEPAPEPAPDTGLAEESVPDGDDAEPDPTGPPKGDDGEKEEEDPKHVGLYRLLAAAVAVLTLGGLFLGLIGNFFAHSAVFTGGTILKGSLLGYLLSFAKTQFTGGSPMFGGSPSAFFKGLALLLPSLVLLAAVVASVVCLFVALFSKRRAERAARFSGTLSLIAYGLMFLYAYCLQSVRAQAYSGALFDVPTALVTAALTILMFAAGVARAKGKALADLLLLVFPLVAVFALVYPASYTAQSIRSIFSDFSASVFYYLMLVLFGAVLLFNLIVGACRLSAVKRYGFDLIRFSVQLLLSVLLIVAACLRWGSWNMLIFENNSLFPTVLTVINSLGALLLSIVMLLYQKGKNGAAETAEPKAAEETAAAAADAAQPQDGEATAGVIAPAAEETAPAELTVVELPAQEPEEPCAPAEALPAAADGAIAEPAPVAIELPAPPPVPMETEPENEPQEEYTDFEREMLSYARERRETAEPSSYTAPAAAEPPADRVAPAANEPVYLRTSALPERPKVQTVTMYNADTQYTYDPFINTLTPDEKNEFGDLFIACKNGTYGDLPVYKIGGDNTVFFNRVWIRYGAYEMSPALKEKLFRYVRKYGKK